MIGRVSNVFIAYRLAQLIRRKGPVVSNHARIDMCELFRRMVFNILIDNNDDHEKNRAFMRICTIPSCSCVKSFHS